METVIIRGGVTPRKEEDFGNTDLVRNKQTILHKRVLKSFVDQVNA